MDLKILLRYQISGSIFIGWFLLFHYSVHSADFADVATKIMDISSLASLIIAMPIGAIIHQFSVTIKNQIFGLCEDSYLSDSPMKNPTRAILRGFRNSNGGEYVKYIDEKISKLNSFYYMRFDSGFLAPLLSFTLFMLIDAKISFSIITLEYLLVYIYFILILILTIIPHGIIKENIKLSLNTNTIPKISTTIIEFIKKKTNWLITAIVILIVIGSVFTSCTHYENSAIELTTKSIQIESNIRYVITNEYSLESSGSMTSDSVIIANGLKNLKSISSILEKNNLQKTSIIESDISNQEESQLHISKAEITKIDATLLNNILIVCLIISFLLLSYIPRIIQELQEYLELINSDSPPKKNINLEDNKLMIIENIYRVNEDLSFVDLSGKTLKNSNFTESNFVNAIFSNSTLENCNFRDADLSRVDFSNATIINCTFTNAKFFKSGWINTTINNSNFENAKIDINIDGAYNAQIVNSTFSEAIFSDNNLKNHIRREFSNIFKYR